MGLFDDFHHTKQPGDLQKGDTLVVWGGGDISPSLYGKKPSRKTWAGKGPSERDEVEWALMQEAIKNGNPIIGVCRGGQMLTAAMGGYLIQHVNNHSGYHDVITKDDEIFEVNSIHHQMMVPPEDKEYELVAWCPTNLSDVYFSTDENGNDEELEVNIEPEFIYYPTIRGFAIQWHPEGLDMQTKANKYLKHYLETFL
jgi:gamma-glutamyl-gamma-aminobutyrate hydrolase PuuD